MTTTIELIPDENLRDTIVEKLQIPAHENVTKEHLKRLEELTSDKSNIANLEGLQHAVNLKHLVVCPS